MEISTFLHWLAREQTNSAVNVLLKFKNIDLPEGNTFATVDEAVKYIEKAVDDPFGGDEPSAVWASVHQVKSGLGIRKLSMANIEAYRYLAFDLDAKVAHRRKVCSTDEERAKTLATANKIEALLLQFGLPQPLNVSSGNGHYLFFPIDLPYTEQNYNLLARLGDCLARLFNDDEVDIDKAIMKNPCVILGVVGTMNRDKAEVPSEQRFAKKREVIGDYPPNEPMTAQEFIKAINALLDEHNKLAVEFDGAPAIATKANKPSSLEAKTEPKSSWNIPSNNFNRCKLYLAKCGDAKMGQGYDLATLRAASECFRFGLSNSEASEMMTWFNATKCFPQWSDKELSHKLKSGWDKVQAKGDFGCKLDEPKEQPNEQPKEAETASVDYPMSDMGNAEHFVATFGDNLKYVVPWKSWLVWDGRQWAKDKDAKARRMGIRFVRHTMLDYVKTIKDDERRTKYIKWAGASQNGNRMDTMLSLASSILACSTEQLDANGNLFNCENGTIELDTLKFRQHDRKDNLTKISTVKFDPSATAPLWDKFINRIFQDTNGEPRKEIVAYIRRASGYTMTVEQCEQVMFLLLGNGRNGKTTFMDAIKVVLGDYAIVGLQSVILKDNSHHIQQNSDDVADLFGARLCSVSETDEGQRFDEAKCKRLVGGGRMSAMRKFEHKFEWDPTHKIWLDCNHKPNVKGTEDGIWRRLKPIPFLVQIPNQERDEHLGDKLKLEASGILNWMLGGLADWRANGLNEPSEISGAVNDYRADSDTFGSFLSDCIIPNDAAKASVADVYFAYLDWTKDNGLSFPMTKIEFGKRMTQRGYPVKASNSKRRFIGCELKTDDANESEDATATVDERTI